jgi:hypothetical protein
MDSCLLQNVVNKSYTVCGNDVINEHCLESNLLQGGLSNTMPYLIPVALAVQLALGGEREGGRGRELTCKANVTRAPGSAGSLVGKSEPGALHWMPGVALGSMQVVAPMVVCPLMLVLVAVRSCLMMRLQWMVLLLEPVL